MSAVENELFLEAKRLLQLIDESKLRNKEEILFVMSMRTRVGFKGEVKPKQVYWLRDIKDRLLEMED